MKTKLVLLALTCSSLLLAGEAAARSEAYAAKSPRQLFAKMDLDRDQSIDEAELVSALQHREERREERMAKIEARDAAEAESLQARIDWQRDDPLLGTPDRAAAFLMANFDSDGDWELDREELGQAFSSLRKWRSAARSWT